MDKAKKIARSRDSPATQAATLEVLDDILLNVSNNRAGTKYNSSKMSHQAVEIRELKDTLNLILENQAKMAVTLKFLADGYMSCKMTLEDTLPFETNGEIFNFMKHDVDYYKRKVALRNLLRTADQSSIPKFVSSLSSLLFDERYRASHRWPSYKTSIIRAENTFVPQDFVQLFDHLLAILVSESLVDQRFHASEFWEKWRKKIVNSGTRDQKKKALNPPADDNNSFLGVESTQEPINVNLVTTKASLDQELLSNKSMSLKEKKQLISRSRRSSDQEKIPNKTPRKRQTRQAGPAGKRRKTLPVLLSETESSEEEAHSEKKQEEENHRRKELYSKFFAKAKLSDEKKQNSRILGMFREGLDFIQKGEEMSVSNINEVASRVLKRMETYWAYKMEKEHETNETLEENDPNDSFILVTLDDEFANNPMP